MKKLILFLLLCSVVYAQKVETIKESSFVTGTDTTQWYNLAGNYEFLYLVVQDTGASYADSIKCYSITKVGTDSLLSLVDLCYAVDSSTTVTNHANTTTKYWLYDAYIDHLLIVYSNATFTNAVRTKFKLMGIKH